VKSRSSEERELGQLIIAANCGEASDEQLARMDELVRKGPGLANFAARLLDQQASLSWHGLIDDKPEPSACRIAVEELASDAARGRESAARRLAGLRIGPMWLTVAVGIGFVLGGLAVSILRNTPNEGAPTQPVAASPAQELNIHPAYEAKLVHSTACLWDGKSMNPLEIGSGLASGESLHLLEGLAEFTLTWSGRGRATLSLEGPAAMMLTTEGMPTLRFGRLSATINASSRPFVLESSVGRLALAEFGSIAVSAFGNEGELHVFSGSATFEPAWRSPEQTAPLRIEAGQSIRIQTGDDGEPQITWHEADSEYFATQVSMNTDSLVIPSAYVNAVKRSKPIGYWRFERDSWPNVPNVMGPEFSCHVNGELGRTTFQGNQAVEFGVSDQGGEIVSDDLISDSIRNDYSVEFWVKPSHYQLGSVVSLVGDTPMKSGVLPHGMLVELGGTGKIPTAIHHPGCIRFLHRSPARDANGTSCYSKTPYTLRKWQHVVATKNGAQMRLYINAEQVAQGEDPNRIPKGLRLLVGSLYPASTARPFNGQIDELALYNRALAEQEIIDHYELVRPTTSSALSLSFTSHLTE
jgi:hypothetical protein